MKKMCLLGFFIFFAVVSSAQKKIEKVAAINDIETIQIAGDGMYEIEIYTTQTDQITMVATVVGETFENIILNTNQTQKVYQISTGESPFYTPIDDKLAAHKVLSFSLQLWVPEKLHLEIVSSTAHILISGRYASIQVLLERGRCNLLNFEGSGSIETQNGAIYGTVTNKVFVVKESRINSDTPNKKNTLRVASKDGKILLSQTK